MRLLPKFFFPIVFEFRLIERSQQMYQTFKIGKMNENKALEWNRIVINLWLNSKRIENNNDEYWAYEAL